MDKIQQSLQTQYLPLKTRNLTNTLSMLQATEKQFHSIPKIEMRICKKTGSLPSFPHFDLG